MTTLYLVRHGHTDYVSKDKLPGRLTGIHLTKRGQAEADQVAEHLRTKELMAVYCSPLDRARETAKPIAEAAGLPVSIRPGLDELDVGKWQGLSLKAARRRKLWASIQFAPSTARFPEGESFIQAQARIVAEIEHLRELHTAKQDAFVCVSHADPIKLVVAHYLGLSLDLFQRLTIAPASISALNLTDHGARLLVLNDTQAAESVEKGG